VEGYIDALELTVIANVTLVLFSFFFMALVYIIRRSTGISKRVRGQRSLSGDKEC
jgi:hypothetical protein